MAFLRRHNLDVNFPSHEADISTFQIYEAIIRRKYLSVSSINWICRVTALSTCIKCTSSTNNAMLPPLVLVLLLVVIVLDDDAGADADADDSIVSDADDDADDLCGIGPNMLIARHTRVWTVAYMSPCRYCESKYAKETQNDLS